MTAGANSALASASVGDRTFSVTTIPHCRVCRHPLRLEIERQVVQGRPYGAIAASLSVGDKVSIDSIRRHVRREHLPVHDEAVERLREQDASERGEIVARGAEVEVNHLSFARGILGQVQRRLASGELQPDLRDGLAAAAHLARFDVEVGFDTQACFEGIRVLIEAVKDIMDPDQFNEFTRRIVSDPVLAELRAR